MQLYTLIIGLLITTVTMNQFSQYRQLLIFGREGNPALVQQQLRLLETSTNDVEERKIKTIIVEKDNLLSKKYKVNTAQFTVILIGRDRTEKHRRNKLLKINELFAIIDAMPMRKAEMGNKRINNK